MRALTALANRIKGIKVDELLMVLGNNKEFTDYIIELNTRNQLFDKGVDSLGLRLDDGRRKRSSYNDDAGVDGYAAVTIYGDPARGIVGKIDKGLPYDRITLNDTGDFYASFKAFYKPGEGFIISADTIKDTTNLISEWGAAILGLNEDSLEKLRIKAKIILIPYVRKKILTR